MGYKIDFHVRFGFFVSRVDDFANNHSDFIEQVNQSFDSMLKNYHVKMPISEIAYLYEYIADDEDERKVASDDEF